MNGYPKPWDRRFARRTLEMKRSAIRELLKLTSAPEVISFAGGLPATDLLPANAVRIAVDKILTHSRGAALQYGETEGLRELREWIAREASARSPRARFTAENVMITAGAQQGLDLLGRVLLDEGDVVAVENPTYLALLSCWRPLGVCFAPIAGDASGMRPEAFRSVLTRRPKLLYTIPSFQNPTGTTLDLSRRRELLDCARENGVGVIEDAAYEALRFDGQEMPGLLELGLELEGAACAGGGEACGVVRVGSFSKVLSPGLRVGWVIGPRGVIEKLVMAKQGTDLHTGSLSQQIVWELVANGFLHRHIPTLCEAYRLRRDAMLRALQQFMPAGVEWTRPEGGLFLFVTLPSEVDAGVLLQEALKRKVGFVPGAEFHLPGKGAANTLRLNYSNADPERIASGIATLGMLVGEEASRRRVHVGFQVGS